MADVKVEDYPYGRHKILQKHERSGRWNLYVAAHLHHLEERDGREVAGDGGRGLIEELLERASGEGVVCSVEWKREGDLIVWDNTCVMVCGFSAIFWALRFLAGWGCVCVCVC